MSRNTKPIEIYEKMTAQVVSLCVFVIGTVVAGLKVLGVTWQALDGLATFGLAALLVSLALGLLTYGRLVHLAQPETFDSNDRALVICGSIQHLSFFAGVGLLVYWILLLEPVTGDSSTVPAATVPAATTPTASTSG